MSEETPSHPARATSLTASPIIELGQIGFILDLSCRYPAYVRGEAQLAAGQAVLPLPSFRESLTTAESSANGGLELWRIWA